MIYTGKADFSFFSQVQVGDILIIETYFFWAHFRINVNYDTFGFKLFPGTKARYRELQNHPQAYLDWQDAKGSTELVFANWRNNQQCSLKKEYFPLDLIIGQFAMLTESRTMLWQYAEFDEEAGFPSFVECYVSY